MNKLGWCVLLFSVTMIAGCAATKTDGQQAGMEKTCAKGSACVREAETKQEAKRPPKAGQEPSGTSQPLHPVPKDRMIPGLTIADATFTDRVVNREPGTRLNSYALEKMSEKARLWFWLKVRCVGACREKLAAQGKVLLTLEWYLESGGTRSRKMTASLSIKGEEWRTWSLNRKVTPGIWKVVVLSENARICLDHNNTCEFSIDVRQ